MKNELPSKAQKIVSWAFLLVMLAVSCYYAFFNESNKNDDMNYQVDRFADIAVLRYRVDGFEDLSLNQKILIYHLSEAAKCGRDILFDQNFAGNLPIRKALENVYTHYQGDKADPAFQAFEEYLKRVWFSNGIHHHYSTRKFQPNCAAADFEKILATQMSAEDSKALTTFIYDSTKATKRVCLDADDVLAASANNYYKNVSQKEAEAFYEAQKDEKDLTPISYGLNSRLEKDANGQIKEVVWKADGEYGAAIQAILGHLQEALPYAENDQQKRTIELLMDFYKTGNLKTFDEYSICWATDTISQVDFVNGFIETYGDALGLKASWESIVNFRNEEATERTVTISSNAQWFENHSPINPAYRKKVVKGVSAKVITNAILGGDSYPATPIGINLPNADWIRKQHGSKSVTIENIMQAYDKAAQGSGFMKEFYENDRDIEAYQKYGFITDVLHTDLHECLGHGSGQLAPGVSGDALKSYGSTIEEARADLFGLYFMADPKMVELGLLPNMEAYKAAYYHYLLNGLLTQCVRIPLGEQLEEAHMRNRQLIAGWVYEHGQENKVVELRKKNGKTYLYVNDYAALRNLFGQLLCEIQRVKSEGDYEAAKKLVDTYAVQIPYEQHQEILQRYEQLHIAPYKGFVNPTYVPVRNEKGEITDVRVDYTENYVDQMLHYSKEYSFL